MKPPLKAVLMTAGVILFLVGPRSLRAQEAPLPLGETVATINGEKITREEFLKTLLSWYGGVTLEEYINIRLLEQEAKKRGITVTDKEVADQLETIRKNTPEFEAQLRQGRLNMAHYANVLKTNLLLRRLIPQKPEMIPDDDLDEARIRHIVVLFKPANDQAEKARNEAEARGKIQKAAEEIRGGLDFAEAARKYSEDVTTAFRGGEMEPFLRYLGPSQAIEQAAFSLKPGEVSPPIKTDYGYHLIRLEEKKLGRELSGEEKKIRKEQVYEKRLPLFMSNWFSEFKVRAKIERPEKME